MARDLDLEIVALGEQLPDGLLQSRDLLSVALATHSIAELDLKFADSCLQLLDFLVLRLCGGLGDARLFSFPDLKLRRQVFLPFLCSGEAFGLQLCAKLCLPIQGALSVDFCLLMVGVGLL